MYHHTASYKQWHVFWELVHISVEQAVYVFLIECLLLLFQFIIV